MRTIPYADLTWPEVAELPRRGPLLIPLGDAPDPVGGGGRGPPRQVGARGLRLLKTTIQGRPRFAAKGIRVEPRRSSVWPWPADLSQRVVVISPGHTEQHGLHLPLETDTRIVAAIADGLRAAVPERVVCLPAWPYGVR